MSLINILKKNRKKLGLELSQGQKAWYLSAETYSCYVVTKDIIKKYVTGSVLDVGAGYLEWKNILLENAATYKSIDVEKRTEGVDYIGDFQNLNGVIENNSFDVLFSNQVLEHIPDTQAALLEGHRVLKKDGILIITTPFLFMLHEEPNDYYRFTKYALKYHLEKAGFEVIDIAEYGNILTVMLHIFSYIILSIAWSFPVIKWLVYYINKYLIVLLPTKIFPSSDKLPAGYVTIAKKIDRV